MNEKQEFITKLKNEVKTMIGTGFYYMFGVELMLDKYGEVIIEWLRKNKNLILKLLQ